LSGGLGQTTWFLAADDLGEYPPNSDKLKTLNYGGGARWFIKPHVAFSLDVRFYVISPGFAYIFPATPRTTLLIIGAGFPSSKVTTKATKNTAHENTTQDHLIFS